VALSKNRIYQGDCVEKLKEVKKKSVDLVFADPPFNIGYEYDVYDDAKTAEEYISWCRKWMKGVYKALKPDGTFWLAIGDEFAAELKVEAQKLGFHCRSWVIWYYTFGVNCVNGFSRSHTHLFHFVKNKTKFTFNRLNPQIRIKSARQMVYADNRANPNGRLPDNTWIIRPQDAPLSFSPSHDTWFFARVAGTFKEREGFHGCQMPEQLLARIIRASSKPQDLVLDPFGGSGTTMCVAKKLARNWIGFELSEEYVDYINERLNRTEIDSPIDGPEDAIESAPSTSKGRRRKKPFDETVEKVVVAAYESAGQGYPVDYLLCDKGLNKEFIKQCLGRGIGGNAAIWNRYLMQLRKSGSLPKSTKAPSHLTSGDLENFGFASEVAWRLLSIDYHKTLDDILCSPDFAEEFDRLAAEYGPTSGAASSLGFRRAAISIRKRAKVARKTASEQFSDWIDGKKKLASIKLGNSLGPLDKPGVFVLSSGDAAVFVDEAQNMRVKVEELLANPNWLSLGTDSVSYVECGESQSMRYGLKSALVQREKPLLNVRLLAHDSELNNE